MKLRIVAILGIALLAAACGTTSRDPQFQKPANLAPKLALTEADIGGHEFSTTDQKGVIWIKPAADGTLTAGGEGKVYEKNGHWSVKDGNFCLEGSRWWKGGNCYELYGASAATVERWRPTKGKWTHMYMPLRRVQ